MHILSGSIRRYVAAAGEDDPVVRLIVALFDCSGEAFRLAEKKFFGGVQVTAEALLRPEQMRDLCQIDSGVNVEDMGAGAQRVGHQSGGVAADMQPGEAVLLALDEVDHLLVQRHNVGFIEFRGDQRAVGLDDLDAVRASFQLGFNKAHAVAEEKVDALFHHLGPLLHVVHGLLDAAGVAVFGEGADANAEDVTVALFLGCNLAEDLQAVTLAGAGQEFRQRQLVQIFLAVDDRLDLETGFRPFGDLAEVFQLLGEVGVGQSNFSTISRYALARTSG